MLIKKINESMMQVQFIDHVERGIIEDAFTLYEPNYFNNVAFKKRFWNGKSKVFYKNDMYPLGLTYDIRKIAEQNGLKISIDNLDDFRVYRHPHHILDYIELLDLPFEPYDHQIQTLNAVYDWNKCIMKVGTNAGKTFITYMLMRYFREVLGLKKILFVVPTSNLLKQARQDFPSYTADTDFIKEITYVGSGYKLDSSKPIVVAMWQSLQNFDDEWFKDVDAIIVDEAHKATADVLHGIILKSYNAKFKVGFTGSIPSNSYQLMKLKGALGKFVGVIDGHELVKKGLSTPVEVDTLTINYTDKAFVDDLKNIAEIENIDTTADNAQLEIYKARISKIYNNPKRNNLLTREILSRDKNTVALYTNLEYARALYKRISKEIDSKGLDKQILYLDGDVNIKQPQKFLEYMEILKNNDNVILIATYKTFATGVNNKNIHYLYFCQSTISELDIVQAIGRLMRLMDGKSTAWIIDVCDNLPSLKNHAKTRLGYYEQEKCYVEERSVDL